jgi:hypothetical protein
MKNKYSNSRLSYFFKPRNHRNVLAWNKPASQTGRGKQATENILRWEDDGGPISELVRVQEINFHDVVRGTER